MEIVHYDVHASFSVLLTMLMHIPDFLLILGNLFVVFSAVWKWSVLVEISSDS